MIQPVNTYKKPLCPDCNKNSFVDVPPVMAFNREPWEYEGVWYCYTCKLTFSMVNSEKNNE